MTYLGIFDGYGKILGHNKSLSIDSLEESELDYIDNLETLATLKRYNLSLIHI